jgi:hypothetical protein
VIGAGDTTATNTASAETSGMKAAGVEAAAKRQGITGDTRHAKNGGCSNDEDGATLHGISFLPSDHEVSPNRAASY